MNEIEMKVLPTFVDDECSIIFSFHFKNGRQKIGEAVICTCSEAFLTSRNGMKEFNLGTRSYRPPGIGNTIAYFKEFQIMEEYKRASLKNILEFLRVIGVRKFLYLQNMSLFHSEQEALA